MKKVGLTIATLFTATLLATGAQAAGDAAKGAKVFKKCAACHSMDAGDKKIGPTLAGFIGRTAGTVEGFKYSKDLAEAGEKGLVWDEAGFVEYMADPKGFIGAAIGKKKAKTRMAFAGLKKESDREDLLAWLLENGAK